MCCPPPPPTSPGSPGMPPSLAASSRGCCPPAAPQHRPCCLPLPGRALQGMPLDPAYMVAFNYGSVVFFNAGPKLRQRLLAVVREVASEPVSSERPYVEGGRWGGSFGEGSGHAVGRCPAGAGHACRIRPACCAEGLPAADAAPFSRARCAAEYCLTLSPQLPTWSSCLPDNIKLQVGAALLNFEMMKGSHLLKQDR